MSRIFEALQRSEAERAGFAFPEPSIVAAEQQEVPEQDLRPMGEFPSVPVKLVPSARLVSLTDKDGLGAEQFRFLAVRLRQLQQTRPVKKLLITSTLPEEGKSMVSANLAATLARRKQQKVLLLEGDLRRPVQTQLFGGAKLDGLSEWLQSGTRTVGNVYFLEGPGFWLMPAGRPPENPLELMQSGKLSLLLDQLGSWFDWVVIDSPPVLPLADTSVWARVADGILMVVREGTSERRQLQRGLEVIDQNRVLGVIINSCRNTVHQDYYSRYSPAAGKSSGAKQEDPSQAGADTEALK